MPSQLTANQNRRFLDFVRSLPCLICQKTCGQAHHLLRTGEHSMGKRSPDRYAVPLCWEHHDELHRLGDEALFFMRYGIDPYRWVRDAFMRWDAPRIAGDRFCANKDKKSTGR